MVSRGTFAEVPTMVLCYVSFLGLGQGFVGFRGLKAAKLGFRVSVFGLRRDWGMISVDGSFLLLKGLPTRIL